MKRKFELLCLFAIIFAQLGFLAENSVRVVYYGIIDNRYHFLPFIGIYGLIPFALTIVGNPDELSFFGHKIFKNNNKVSIVLSNILYLLIICLAVAVGEIAIGTTYEALAHVKLWDYSDERFHITSYTSLLSISGYGIGAFIITKIFFPIYNKLLKSDSMNFKAYKYIYLVLVIDMIVMMLKTAITKSKPIYYSFNLGNKFLSILVLLLISIAVLSIVILIPYFISKKRSIKKLNNTQVETHE